MASNPVQSLLHCNGCRKELNLESKTLPCLHSFCRSCLESNFEGQADGNGQCQECHEHLTTLDQLTLSPFLVKSLRRQQLESTDWKCDLCLDDGIQSIAIDWCHECEKLFCVNCSRYHKKFQRKHNTRNLEEMERGDAIKLMTTDMCCLHQASKDSYCEKCNVCFCDTCYQNHSTDSAECSSHPVSVREEALKQKSQGPTLAKGMDDLEISLRRLNERTRNYTEELNSDCHSKCKQLWLNFEEMRENAKQKTEELCQEMKQITTKQVTMWRHLLEENEKILKQLEIWRLNLHHLLGESPQDVDVVCGLRMLGSKLSSQQNKSIRPEEKCELRLTFPNWWVHVLKQLKSENIGSVSWTGGTLPAVKNLVELPVAENFKLMRQWNLHRSDLNISCICFSTYLFVGDMNDKSIIGYTEYGRFVCECVLFDGINKFEPCDITVNSEFSTLAVACRLKRGNAYENKLMFLQIRKERPFLKITKVIDTEKTIRTLCYFTKYRTETLLFTCDTFFQMYSSKRGVDDLNMIRPGELSSHSWPRICSQLQTSNFWATRNYSEIFCFNQYGEKIQSMKIEEKFSDFCLDNDDHLLFCNLNGIFYFSPQKIMYEFEKKSEVDPRIFIKYYKEIFVSLKIDGKFLIKQLNWIEY